MPVTTLNRLNILTPTHTSSQSFLLSCMHMISRLCPAMGKVPAGLLRRNRERDASTIS